ncbi:hypothetical protein [uncultured Kordia sp.]|uniref:hypothetical protein n=1 Tax=uncultured Kordia sp. TaxID=507699 RepID=UPI00261104A2|nr:hypothetical protein [uncultured Kordia sp.]
MKHFVSVVIVALFVSACYQQPQKKTVATLETSQISNEIKKNTYPFSNVSLYDDFSNELILDTLQFKREAQFSPLYIGDEKKTIKLVYKTSKLAYNGTEFDRDYRIPTTSDIQIFIDTTRTIGFSMPMAVSYNKTEYRTNKKSYPVFIKNTSNKIHQIGIGEILYMKTEAKDSTGNWREIERDFMYFCGTGLARYYLNPNQIAITAFRQNYGRFKTKFRIKFGSFEHPIYSNEIDGYLNFEL